MAFNMSINTYRESLTYVSFRMFRLENFMPVALNESIRFQETKKNYARARTVHYNLVKKLIPILVCGK